MKRNVLQLIGSFHEGGSERQALQLARLLKGDGRYRVHVACLDSSGVLRGEADAQGLGEIPEFPLTSFYNRRAFRQLRRFAQFLREREIDVVHTHDFYTNVFGMPAALLARVPARIASRRETTGWRTGPQKFVERRAYDLAHTVIANSEAVRNQLILEGVRNEKTVTIYNGVNIERVGFTEVRRDDVLASFNLVSGENNQLVTIVANMRHKVKNHAMFLRSARAVSQAMPRARFVIAGEGELMTSVRVMCCELGLRDKVSFIGRCDRIGELLSLSDVCVLSSMAEGFSNSILEYMAAARPVVATDVGGAREAIVEDETGYLVPPDDDVTMAERIIALLRDPRLARDMGKRGRRIIEERFSCEAQLEKTGALYDRLLSHARPRWRRPLKARSEVSIEAKG
jgi:glycosyltransferase involved in cell wall biosynthesis